MDFGLKEKELQAIIDTLSKEPYIEKAVIFGSRARNDYKKTSDIDIAIFGKDVDSTQLNLLRDRLDQLDMIYKLDVVDFCSLTKEGLKKNIVTEGRQIYPPVQKFK